MNKFPLTDPILATKIRDLIFSRAVAPVFNWKYFGD